MDLNDLPANWLKREELVLLDPHLLADNETADTDLEGGSAARLCICSFRWLTEGLSYDQPPGIVDVEAPESSNPLLQAPICASCLFLPSSSL
jgi:hypothetical protein